MKVLITIYTLFFIVASSPAQIKLQWGGTFIVAAICKDGIIAACDTRASFLDKDGHVAAYFEGESKLYADGKTILGMAGIYSFDEITLSGLFNGFTSSNKTRIPLADYKEAFMNYAKKILKPAEYAVLSRNYFMTVGYQNGKPLIYTYHENRVDSITQTGYLTTDESVDNMSIIKRDLKNADFIKATEIIKEILSREIEDDNSNRIGTIGGPVFVARLTESSLNWARLGQQVDYKTRKDLIEAYNRREFTIKYRSTMDSVNLQYVFTKYLKRR
jgi:hypothetical protein